MKKIIKSVKIFCLGFMLLFVISNCVEKANAQQSYSCSWYGTAPFCDGECPTDWDEIKRSTCEMEGEGCGRSCWTGSKACCRKR